jgi:hypothetical protein
MNEPVSLRRLNELLAEVLTRRSGLITPDEHAFKPWLPESYWRERAAEEGAYANLAKARRREEDERLANMSVDELLGDNIPKLFEPTEAHFNGRWGTHSMRNSHGGMLKAPTPGSLQPQYHFECCQCGLPITVDGYDHDHNRLCDLALMDPAVFETEDHDVYHTPKPWKGEEEDDDETED